MKKNKFGMDTISFKRWPKEFNNFLQVDYDLMIKKFFIKKINYILDVMGKKSLLNKSEINKNINFFFK